MDFQFSAELSDFKIIHNVLKAISFKDHAIFRPLKEGLKITLEEMRCVETSAYMLSNVFSSYTIGTDDEIKFKINLKVFIECLHIYGEDGNVSLKMTYKGSGSPLYLVIKQCEENVTVDCQIFTLNVDDSVEINLAYECTLNKIVLNAVGFMDILTDLDNFSNDIELLFSPDYPNFQIITTSSMGESKTDIPKDSEMVLMFQCNSKESTKYSFNHIQQILKVMSYADKVSISTGSSGLLGLQFVISSEEKQMYVEYYVTAMYLDD